MGDCGMLSSRNLVPFEGCMIKDCDSSSASLFSLSLALEKRIVTNSGVVAFQYHLCLVQAFNQKTALLSSFQMSRNKQFYLLYVLIGEKNS